MVSLSASINVIRYIRNFIQHYFLKVKSVSRINCWNHQCGFRRKRLNTDTREE
jgi:hypothetical protein